MRSTKVNPRPRELRAESFRNVQIRFAGCPHARRCERQATFIHNCNSNKLLLALPSNGLNFDLNLSETKIAESQVEFVSRPFLFNGTLVQWRGFINRNTLMGEGTLEMCHGGVSNDEAPDIAMKKAELVNKILQLAD